MATEKRLIDANKLKNRLGNLEASGGHKYYRKGMDDVLHKHMPTIIDEQPTVDAVEVVRCRDCKHYANYGRVWDCQKYGCMSLPNEDDFCSYGERRSPENE